MYASINEKFNVRSSSFGTQGYNVVQCSDDMWYEDTLNDIWDLHISHGHSADIRILRHSNINNSIH